MVKHLKSEINTYSLKVARQYRGYSQTELAKNVKGLSQSNLSKFEKGYWGVISESKLREIMNFLNWPFDFLYKDIKPLKISEQINLLTNEKRKTKKDHGAT